jgi:tetratricopeptide (TPR) repeat protein
MKRTFFVLLLATLPAVGQSRGPLSAEAIFAKCEGSVVTIFTFDANRAPLGQGSGFVIAKNRIITNYHVLAGSASASVVFSDGSTVVVKGVVAASAPNDLAIVEAETGRRLFLSLGNELELKVGETVYAIGAPKGLSNSLSNGLVSSFRQDEGQFLIQITAPIAPGSSGGPLLNSQGLVVGVTTLRLKGGGFSFAIGAGDIQHLLKAQLGVELQLSDLPGEDDNSTPATQLSAVQALYDQKKYADAHSSFDQLSDAAKQTFDAQLLLCRIDEQTGDYGHSIEACNAAIASRPNSGDPYEVKALSLLMSGNSSEAELSASKAVELSDNETYKEMLGLIYYTEEKYDLAGKELPAASDDPFVLSMLAGAALHNRDYKSFYRFRDRLTILNPQNGWALFTSGITAETDLDWSTAVDDFRKCDKDSNFIDPICVTALTNVEITQANYGQAKSDFDSALSRYPKSTDLLSAGVFLELLLGNPKESDRLHKLLGTNSGDATDCLYYYGRGEPSLATSHCDAAIRANGTAYTTWSNAGYVALDNRNFQLAVSYFAKANQLFYGSKDKHTVTQEVDLAWGTILAEYFSGDKKTAKSVFKALKKEYPDFLSTAALKQLPLVWSDSTIELIEAANHGLR